MKVRIQFFAVAITVAGMMLLAFPAQQAGAQQRARGIHTEYESGKSDGMRVVVYKVEGERLTPVDPSHVFKQGDKMRVAFEGNFDGFAYVVNVEPSGKKRVIFPHLKTTNVDNRVRARHRYVLPFVGNFVFDEQKGLEILQVIMSREPIPYLDDAIQSASGELGETASNAAAELSGNMSKPAGIDSTNVTRVLPPSGGGGLRARDVILALGKDNEEAGSVAIAIPDNKPADTTMKAKADDKPEGGEKSKEGKLKSGDYLAIEVRLQHN